MFYMERKIERAYRKISRHGTSYRIVIPKEWVEPDVDIYEIKKENGKLVLRPVR